MNILSKNPTLRDLQKALPETFSIPLSPFFPGFGEELKQTYSITPSEDIGYLFFINERGKIFSIRTFLIFPVPPNINVVFYNMQLVQKEGKRFREAYGNDSESGFIPNGGVKFVWRNDKSIKKYGNKYYLELVISFNRQKQFNFIAITISRLN